MRSPPGLFAAKYCQRRSSAPHNASRELREVTPAARNAAAITALVEGEELGSPRPPSLLFTWGGYSVTPLLAQLGTPTEDS
jgi:hypothetical protein